MNEGWYGDDDLILFAEPEIREAGKRYAISEFLPGLQVVGLRGWDDFIVRDTDGRTYSVPTVPVELQYLKPFSLPDPALVPEPDERFRGKIKWYTKPVVFGGDPNFGDNMTWVSHEEHAQLVRWWNDLYRSTANNKSDSPM